MPYPTWAAGQRVTAALLTAAQPALIYKTADESVTSSTTLQNDDHLFVAVAANATYAIDCWLNFLANSPPDIKADWTIPAGATMNWAALGTGTANYSDHDASIVSHNVARGGKGNPGVPQSMNARGYLITGGTAGTLQLRWAQNTSNASATVLRAGSWIRLQRNS